MQREVAGFNAAEQEAVTIKLGVHEGPCIAVTLNGRLDYFGTTVNMAARLQGKSEGGDLVISRAIAEDPQVAALLDGLDCSEETTLPEGFRQPRRLLSASASRDRRPPWYRKAGKAERSDKGVIMFGRAYGRVLAIIALTFLFFPGPAAAADFDLAAAEGRRLCGAAAPC